MKLDHDDLNRLIEKISTSDIQEFSLEGEDFKLEIKRNLFDNNQIPNNSLISNTADKQISSSQKPVSDNVAVTSSPEVAQVAPPGRSDLTEITSPMVGTFYRAAAPGEEPFVEVGNNIKVGDVWEIQEDTAYENCLKAPTCQQATRTCEGRDEETCQETASPCEFMDNEERWDRLWVMLKKPSEKLDFLYEKTHMNVRNDFQPKEWGEVGEEDEESREETIKNQIKKAMTACKPGGGTVDMP